MQIEAGKFYRTRDGRKVGPMIWKAEKFVSIPDKGYWEATGQGSWYEAGTESWGKSRSDGDIVAEWQDEPTGPVRTVTRWEIVPGVYGRLHVDLLGADAKEEHGRILLRFADRAGTAMDGGNFTSLELRSMAMVLSQLAEALDDNKDADNG